MAKISYPCPFLIHILISIVVHVICVNKRVPDMNHINLHALSSPKGDCINWFHYISQYCQHHKNEINLTEYQGVRKPISGLWSQKHVSGPWMNNSIRKILRGWMTNSSPYTGTQFVLVRNCMSFYIIILASPYGCHQISKYEHVGSTVEKGPLLLSRMARNTKVLC